MVEYSVIKYVLKTPEGNIYVIHKYRNKYILVSHPQACLLISNRLRDLLRTFYGKEARIISIYFDRNGDMHVKYEAPFYDVDDTLVDYMFREDVWRHYT